MLLFNGLEFVKNKKQQTEKTQGFYTINKNGVTLYDMNKVPKAFIHKARNFADMSFICTCANDNLLNETRYYNFLTHNTEKWLNLPEDCKFGLNVVLATEAIKPIYDQEKVIF